jgi:hypothetical protein
VRNGRDVTRGWSRRPVSGNKRRSARRKAPLDAPSRHRSAHRRLVSRAARITVASVLADRHVDRSFVSADPLRRSRGIPWTPSRARTPLRSTLAWRQSSATRARRSSRDRGGGPGAATRDPSWRRSVRISEFSRTAFTGCTTIPDGLSTASQPSPARGSEAELATSLDDRRVTDCTSRPGRTGVAERPHAPRERDALFDRALDARAGQAGMRSCRNGRGASPGRARRRRTASAARSSAAATAARGGSLGWRRHREAVERRGSTHRRRDRRRSRRPLGRRTTNAWKRRRRSGSRGRRRGAARRSGREPVSSRSSRSAASAGSSPSRSCRRETPTCRRGAGRRRAATRTEPLRARRSRGRCRGGSVARDQAGAPEAPGP